MYPYLITAICSLFGQSDLPNTNKIGNLAFEQRVLGTPVFANMIKNQNLEANQKPEDKNDVKEIKGQVTTDNSSMGASDQLIKLSIEIGKPLIIPTKYKFEPEKGDYVEFDPSSISKPLFSSTEKRPPYTLTIGDASKLGDFKVKIRQKRESGQTEDSTFIVSVEPDAMYLTGIIKQRFPFTNIQITVPKIGLIFVDGTVQNPTDVDNIVNTLKYFTKLGSENIQNNIKVTGPTQIQLHVIIARVDRSEIRRLGLDFLVNSSGSIVGNQVSAAMNAVNQPITSAQDTTTKLLTPLATPFFGINAGSAQLYGYIDALRRNNVAKILANPTLVAYNGRQADFLVGGQVPIPVTGSITAPTVNYKEFGTRLSFIPVMIEDGKIRLEVAPEVSSLDETSTSGSNSISGLRAYNFKTQRLHATVELKPGETLFLGGLLQTEFEAESNKLYGLGDLPGIGGLFRNSRVKATEKELLILVTPRLVQPLECNTNNIQFPGQSTTSPTDWDFVIKGAIESAQRPGQIPKKPVYPRLGDEIKSLIPAIPVPPTDEGAKQNLLPPPKISILSSLFRGKEPAKSNKELASKN